MRGYHHYVSPARTCASTCWARSCAKKYLYVRGLLLAARWIREARRAHALRRAGERDGALAALAHRLPGGRAGAPRALAEEEFSLVRGYHHYVSMARKNLREHLLGEVVRYKKYLTCCGRCWRRAGSGKGARAPMRFAELASEMVTDPALLEELNALLAVKMRAGEAATSPRWPGLHDFILRELEAAQAHVPVAGDRPDLARLDRLREAVLHFDAAPA